MIISEKKYLLYYKSLEMPWRIDKVGDKYKLYNLDKKKYVNKTFNTRKSAIATRKNYGRYSYGKKKNPYK